MKWEDSRKELFSTKQFLIRRGVKLASSVWPFLIILTILYQLFHIDYSLWNLTANFAFLGYLFKLPGNGHLWFMTVLMVCYGMFAILSRNVLSKRYMPFIMVWGVTIFILFELMGVPGNTFLILGLCACVFLSPACFLKSQNTLLILSLIILNIVSIYLSSQGLFDRNRIAAYLLSDACGVSWLWLLLRLVPHKKVWVVSWLSSISFEMYIVHHTLSAGPFIRVHTLTENICAQLVLLFGLTIVLALLLHQVSVWVSPNFNKLLY